MIYRSGHVRKAAITPNPLLYAAVRDFKFSIYIRRLVQGFLFFEIFERQDYRQWKKCYKTNSGKYEQKIIKLAKRERSKDL